jgi:hypothetical protein
MGFQCQFKENNISITDRRVLKQDCVQFCHVLYHDVARFLIYCKWKARCWSLQEIPVILFQQQTYHVEDSVVILLMLQ